MPKIQPERRWAWQQTCAISIPRATGGGSLGTALRNQKLQVWGPPALESEVSDDEPAI